MPKHVYIIKNKINGKVYIGQTSQSLGARFNQHCNASHTSLIHRAIKKYGRENFSIESLYCGEDYNQKEKELILKYRSTDPTFGYNIQEGGEEPPVHLGDDSPFALFDSSWYDETIKMITETTIPLNEIARLRGCNPTTLSRINLGQIRFNPSFKYPLRKTHLEPEEVAKIKKMFILTDLSQGEIAELMGVKVRTVKAIRSGQNHREEGLQYPLGGVKIKSSLASNQIEGKIKKMLEDKYPIEHILKRFRVSHFRVDLINKGLIYFEEDRKYPINKDIKEAVETRSLIAS